MAGPFVVEKGGQTSFKKSLESNSLSLRGIPLILFLISLSLIQESLNVFQAWVVRA